MLPHEIVLCCTMQYIDNDHQTSGLRTEGDGKVLTALVEITGYKQMSCTSGYKSILTSQFLIFRTGGSGPCPAEF